MPDTIYSQNNISNPQYNNQDNVPNMYQENYENVSNDVDSMGDNHEENPYLNKTHENSEATKDIEDIHKGFELEKHHQEHPNANHHQHTINGQENTENIIINNHTDIHPHEHSHNVNTLHNLNNHPQSHEIPKTSGSVTSSDNAYSVISGDPHRIDGSDNNQKHCNLVPGSTLSNCPHPVKNMACTQGLQGNDQPIGYTLDTVEYSVY